EDLPALLEKMEPIVNDGPGRNVWPVIKSAVNPKAFRSVTAGLTLEKGTLRYRLVARLNAGEKSPVLELLPTTPVPKELLHFAPKGAMMVAATSNADGERRLATVFEWADNTMKAFGPNNQLPSHYLEQFETLVLQAKVGKDLAGKVAAAAVAMGDSLGGPEGGTPPQEPPGVL